MNFVNLYIETEYTMLTSTIKIKQLIARAKANNCKAIAITDLNNMHGSLKFYQAADEANIKPIIGLHITLSSDYNFYNSLLVYAQNEAGYRNLLILSSRAKTNKKIDLDFLSKHSYGVLAIIPSDENEIIKLFKEKSIDKAKALLNEYKNIFNDLYIGVDCQTEAAKMHIDTIIEFGNTFKVKSVAINKTSYLDKEDFDAYQVLRCIDLSLNQYLYSDKEMSLFYLDNQAANHLFRNYPDLIKTTSEIADKCNLKLEFNKYKLPFFSDALGKSYEYLTALCKFGLNKRLKHQQVDNNIYKERLIYELDIINTMGFCDYFLIVYDFVKYAKKNKILVGPGRGSAPGSLVSYVLGITEIDPIKHDLLFERFLNPERISMPDIDMDFPDNKRDEVIQYVLKKYGKARIAHISTFGTFGVRLGIRDVARVMKIGDVVLNEILKFIPQADSSMSNIIEANELFRDLINSNEQVRRLINIVLKIEGLPRHTSTHAAGVIMADSDLVNYTALQDGINGLYQTQYEASDLEKIGLVKFDFLGLRNLTIIDEVVKKVKKEFPDFDLTNIPMDDKYTYQMIAQGDTDGIFQLESAGMRNVLISLKTSEFMDIVNANALFRPGPMEMIPTFVKRKFNLEPVDYIHNDLKGILEPTYGTIVFQEQIMLIAQKFAGYSLGMSDILRRAVSKKSSEILNNERKRFINSAQNRGYDESVSNKVYDYIVKFANYGFNKSHSVAYSLISYQMSYLKRRYYKYFMSELMTNSIGSVSLIKNYINDCNKKKVVVYGPSVNYSEDYFAVKDGAIYYSLLGIQNLGILTLNSLLAERKENGLYKSYDDFIARTKEILNKRVVESMILAGALDEFNITRKQMVEEYDNSINISNYSLMLKDNLLERKYSDEEYTYEEISELEKQMLGFNLKYSLFAKYIDLAEKVKAVQISNFIVTRHVKVIFAIKRIKVIMTKRDEEMAFVSIYDDSDEIDGVMFPETYKKYKNILIHNTIYLGEGSVEERNGKLQFVLNIINMIK